MYNVWGHGQALTYQFSKVSDTSCMEEGEQEEEEKEDEEEDEEEEEGTKRTRQMDEQTEHG